MDPWCCRDLYTLCDGQCNREQNNPERDIVHTDHRPMRYMQIGNAAMLSICRMLAECQELPVSCSCFYPEKRHPPADGCLLFEGFKMIWMELVCLFSFSSEIILPLHIVWNQVLFFQFATISIYALRILPEPSAWWSSNYDQSIRCIWLYLPSTAYPSSKNL